METGNLPMDRFRAGGVTAALWDNHVQFKGKPVRMLKVSIERRYKDKNGLWQSSNPRILYLNRALPHSYPLRS